MLGAFQGYPYEIKLTELTIQSGWRKWIMTNTLVLENNLVADFNRDTFEKEVDYKEIFKVITGIAVTTIIGVFICISAKFGVPTQAQIAEREYFGDAVSISEADYAEGLVDDFFEEIDLSEPVAEIRNESTFSYDNADAEARAIELLAKDTELISIDRVTSIEDEYRVYITINTVNASELMNSNRAYLSQAFCSNKNEVTENGINKVVLEVIEKDAEADSFVETYVTVKDDVVDVSQLVFTLRNIYKNMRSIDL